HPVLKAVLKEAGINTLGKLLADLGYDLDAPLDLSNLKLPGVNLTTAGSPFTLLKLALGLDLGWVPALPNSAAADINNTDYLTIGTKQLAETLLDVLPAPPSTGIWIIDNLFKLLDNLTELVEEIVLGNVLDVRVIDLRVPIAVGVGMGAFAIATGYDKVLADLPNQPGGANFQGTNPLLGSYTILPMLLLFNPARPNGGALARFYPLFGLMGIDVVNPRTEVTSSVSDSALLRVPIGNTGLTVGGANLIPILIDVGLEYHPSSDLAAWPNPFTLANNAMALVPLYALRGFDLSRVDDQLTDQLGDILDGILTEPLALNLYLTLPANSLPLLEPLYLTSDLITLASLGTLAVNPVGQFANAIAPALRALVDLGYTDVVRNADGTYTRTLTEADVPTAFFSFPDVNPLLVPGDIFNLLLKGFYKEFLSGNPTVGTPNALTGLLSLFTGGGLGLGGLNGIIPVGGTTGGANQNPIGGLLDSLLGGNSLLGGALGETTQLVGGLAGGGQNGNELLGGVLGETTNLLGNVLGTENDGLLGGLSDTTQNLLGGTTDLIGSVLGSGQNQGLLGDTTQSLLGDVLGGGTTENPAGGGGTDSNLVGDVLGNTTGLLNNVVDNTTGGSLGLFGGLQQPQSLAYKEATDPTISEQMVTLDATLNGIDDGSTPPPQFRTNNVEPKKDETTPGSGQNNNGETQKGITSGSNQAAPNSGTTTPAAGSENPANTGRTDPAGGNNGTTSNNTSESQNSGAQNGGTQEESKKGGSKRGYKAGGKKTGGAQSGGTEKAETGADGSKGGGNQTRRQGPRHAKPDNAPPSVVGSGAPRHAKADDDNSKGFTFRGGKRNAKSDNGSGGGGTSAGAADNDSSKSAA
ncbi:PE-PPE domain protein, partial [Mycolicibacterium hassiacum DSM 44199]